jgi:hypothetical protein
MGKKKIASGEEGRFYILKLGPLRSLLSLTILHAFYPPYFPFTQRCGAKTTVFVSALAAFFMMCRLQLNLQL